MKFKANLLYKPGSFQMDDCKVEKVLELSHDEFCKLKITPGENQPFIAENKDCMYVKDGYIHCLLALGDGERDGVLIHAQGYHYPRYAAYIPGMRDIVNAELERAADFIIQRCTGNMGTESWQAHFNNRPACGNCHVPLQELEEQLGLTIRDGNGLDTMLLDTLRRRPEVSAVELSDGCIDTDYDLSPGKGTAARKKKAPVHFTSKRKAQMFENAVSTVCEIFEDDDLYTMLHNSFGMTLQEIRAGGYMSDREIALTCGVPEELLECDMTVRDVLNLDAVNGRVCLSCDGSDCLVPLDRLRSLEGNDQDKFATLLDARVADISLDKETRLVLEGVEAAELDRLHGTLEAQEQTGQAMGP